MNEVDGTVRCLALPLAGERLLVPNAVVAEVFAAESITPTNDGPDWLLGHLVWRGSKLPLVGLEAALDGIRLEAGPRSKVVVLNALSGSASLEHYGVLVQGIPHQVLASERTLELDASVTDARPFVAVELLVDGERAFIPDLDSVERALLELGSDDSGGEA